MSDKKVDLIIEAIEQVIEEWNEFCTEEEMLDGLEFLSSLFEQCTLNGYNL